MKNAEFIYDKVLEIVGDKNRVLQDVPLKLHTTFKIGGPADVFVLPESAEEADRIMEVLKDVPHLVIGNGSNILVKDNGFRGVVIKMGSCMSDIKTEGEVLTVQAGALLSGAASAAAQASLTGMEFAAGIPGSFGGAVFMNAGAYGGEMSQIVESVTALMPEGKVRKFKKHEIDFGYRHSVFCDNGGLILEGQVRLKEGNPDEIRSRMKELAGRRAEKQPLSYPSAGSTFKRPEGYFAGKLIEDAGCKGLSLGGAEVSSKHAGFIINKGNASAAEVLDLIKLVQLRVKEQFGVDLEPEVRIVGE